MTQIKVFRNTDLNHLTSQVNLFIQDKEVINVNITTSQDINCTKDYSGSMTGVGSRNFYIATVLFKTDKAVGYNGVWENNN